jgi:hypothetical protein
MFTVPVLAQALAEYQCVFTHQEVTEYAVLDLGGSLPLLCVGY